MELYPPPGSILGMPTSDGPSLKPERMKERRGALGLSQEQVAERAGVSQETVSRYERGAKHKPSGDNERAIAAALETTVEYLTGKTDAHAVGARELTLVPDESPARRGVRKLVDEGSLLEQALDLAYDDKRHRPSDVLAVRDALASFDQKTLADSDAELVEQARAWLDATRVMRSKGLEVTKERLFGWMSSSRHQRGQDVDAAAGKVLTDEMNRDTFKETGMEPGSAAHKLDAALDKVKPRRAT